MAALYGNGTVIIKRELYELKEVRPGSELDQVCKELLRAKGRGENWACEFNGVLIHSNMKERFMKFKVLEGQKNGVG